MQIHILASGRVEGIDCKKRAFGFYDGRMTIYYLFISKKDPYYSLLRDEGKCRRSCAMRHLLTNREFLDLYSSISPTPAQEGKRKLKLINYSD